MSDFAAQDGLVGAVLGTVGDLGLAPDAEPETGEPATDDVDALAADDGEYSVEADEDADGAEDETGHEPSEDGDQLSEDELRAELARAKKALAYERGERVKHGRADWLREAAEHYPYADASVITADSRREFIRQARLEHTRIEAHVAPILERQATEQKAAIAAAYGTPTIGVGAPAAGANEPLDVRGGSLGDARRRGSLTDAIRARVAGGEV
jgi:hypothetical protein